LSRIVVSCRRSLLSLNHVLGNNHHARRRIQDQRVRPAASSTQPEVFNELSPGNGLGNAQIGRAIRTKAKESSCSKVTEGSGASGIGAFV
jgi:hypothetical protein